ncbi:OmpW/AlkL family protein [Paraburkholderia aspalathi]|uniref:OmpW/AlkL family protein n=1 Tax=Paraburkholderia aspalathi TaxID=1324617 RepID=UPI001BA80634|nr:OmpW family protein [Paraburkholderia aspalathi]
MVTVLTVVGLQLLAGTTARAAGAENGQPDSTATSAEQLPTSGFFLNAGPGGVLFDAGASVKAAGVSIPGATVNVDSNATLIVSGGYHYGPYQISVTGGFPPLTSIRGAGALAPLGLLGQARYGPLIVEGQYRFPQIGRFQPYIGGGPVFLIIFRNTDGAVHSLKVNGSTGGVVGGGFDYILSKQWSINFAVKKIFLSTSASGYLGQTPISARIRLDPVLVTLGVSRHF